MDGNESSSPPGGTPQASHERRRHPRIYGLYPALVRGEDVLGQKFQDEALITDLSVGGSYLLLKRPVLLAGKLFVVVRLAGVQSRLRSGPLLALAGEILRVEPIKKETWGIAIVLTNYRFLQRAGQ